MPGKGDACPSQAGISGFKGCPDKNNDGIPDPQDKCPAVPGSPLFWGCPDSNNDEGIIKQQVDAARVKAMDFGKSHPPGNNKTAEGQAWNRRVAFKVSQ
jgi:hypothetical protein